MRHTVEAERLTSISLVTSFYVNMFLSFLCKSLHRQEEYTETKCRIQARIGIEGCGKRCGKC